MLLDDSALDAEAIENLPLDNSDSVAILRTAEDMTSTMLSLRSSLVNPEIDFSNIFGELSSIAILLRALSVNNGCRGFRTTGRAQVLVWEQRF